MGTESVYTPEALADAYMVEGERLQAFLKACRDVAGALRTEQPYSVVYVYRQEVQEREAAYLKAIAKRVSIQRVLESSPYEAGRQ